MKRAQVQRLAGEACATRGAARRGANLRRRASCTLAGLIVLALAYGLVPLEAAADCTPANPAAGETVSCSGDTPSGFQAGAGVKDLVVDVETGATVGDAGVAAAILVNPGSAVNNDGTVTVDQAGGVGLLGTNDALDAAADTGTALTNTGTIEVNGVGARGMQGSDRVRTDPRIVQENMGTIRVSADDGIAMDAGASGIANNRGRIELGTPESPIDGAVGIAGGPDRAELINRPSGVIEGYGKSLTGIRVADDNDQVVNNRGTILLTGDNAIGMDSGALNQRQLRFLNDGTQSGVGLISITGADGIGMRAGDGSRARNSIDATIQVQGANATGILVGDDSPLVLNQGTIEIDGANARGIVAGSGDGEIQNFTTLTVTGSVNPVGILAGPGHEINNEGPLRVTGRGAIGLDAGADVLAINEEGQIDVEGTGAVGVRLGGGDNQLGNTRVTTDGDDARIQATGTGAVGVLGRGGNDTIENVAAEIAASGAGAVAVVLGPGTNVLVNRSNGTADVEFRGVIRVAGSTPGIAVLGGSGSDRVRNEADIVGTIDLQPGDDLFEFGTEATWFGNFIEGGEGMDEVVLFGTGSNDAPRLEFFSGFENLRITEGGSWGLRGIGFFESTAVESQPGENTTLVLDSLVGLAGTYDQGAGTGLDVQLTGTSAGGLVTGGAITVDPMGTVLTVDVGEGTFGDFTILSSGTSLTGEFADLTLTGRGLIFSDVSYSADSLVVSLVRSFSENATNANQLAIGNYLNAGFPDAQGDFQNALALFGALSDDDATLALDQMSAEACDAQTSTALTWGRSATGVLEDRPVRYSFRYARKPRIRSKERCGKLGLTPWVEGVGMIGQRNQTPNYLGFANGGGGVMLGVDHRFGGRFWATVDLGTGLIGLDIDTIGTGTLQTVDTGGALGVDLGRGYLRGILSYSHGWHTTRRDIDYLATRATGAHDSDRVTTVIDGGYPFPVGYFFVEPVVSLRYTYLSQEGVSETGAPGVKLDLPSRTDSFFSTSIGLRMSTALFKYDFINDYLEWADGLWTPEVNVNWRQIWTGADRQLDAVMPDAPASAGAYRVDAKDANSGVEFGARVQFQPLDWRTSFAFEYQGFWSNRDLNHHLGLSARVPF